MTPTTIDTVLKKTAKDTLPKLEEAVHHIIASSIADHPLPTPLLHTLLYVIDFDFYEVHKKRLTGETYIKGDDGPFASHLENVILPLLERTGKISSIRPLFRRGGEVCYSSLTAPEESHLRKFEIDYIHNSIRELSSLDRETLFQYPRGDIPYRNAEEGDTLDYESVFFRDGTYAKTEYTDPVPSGSSLLDPYYYAQITSIIQEGETAHNIISLQELELFLNQDFDIPRGILTLAPDGNFSLFWEDDTLGSVTLRFKSLGYILCLTYKNGKIEEQKIYHNDYGTLFDFIYQSGLNELLSY